MKILSLSLQNKCWSCEVQFHNQSPPSPTYIYVPVQELSASHFSNTDSDQSPHGICGLCPDGSCVSEGAGSGKGRMRMRGQEREYKSKNLQAERRRRQKLSDRLLALRALVLSSQM
ncbi:hypothetical protein CK203_035593 [Vitis vinifera]|uniref:BHLH domain-containing protein n=1 Tax=Vitis vinifera TaxID=29760 RepID=A0A438HPN5_VITVI|nr:hypothetical protein CK203_035593 [Vitis vinifera]